MSSCVYARMLDLHRHLRTSTTRVRLAWIGERDEIEHQVHVRFEIFGHAERRARNVERREILVDHVLHASLDFAHGVEVTVDACRSGAPSLA